MQPELPAPTYLSDYLPPDFAVTHVSLTVRLEPENTLVTSRLDVVRKTAGAAELRLDGEDLALIGIRLDGSPLPETRYHRSGQTLVIDVGNLDHFTLEIEQACNPRANTALSGLYLSNGIYCTQMEAEGFRRFAFMQDRPDVVATYRVRIEAPQTLPVLLSNGNPVSSGRLDVGWHFAEWDDPHPKPTYLFALVAGDLASVHDTFRTSEGRDVSLGVYVERGKEDRCAWAVEALKASMRWDEDRFGRAYDLDVFNIVAVSDFNMGAMENKGLNVFNDKYILARPDTATDTDYINIERIIAHEYFHNWTGNRITCRDWFQLCLKEGLTVFRDQEFTSDVRSRAVKRIEDVRTLRARQFPEDQGPLAHAVRPSSYIEINNFYTPTIYEKGAEICRMMQTLIGEAAFRKGMDLYFARHDGEAATVEDFVRSMADASGRDFEQFMLWYAQAGTPVVQITSNYDAAAQQLTLHVSQHTPPTPGQSEKRPMHIPLQIGLVAADGVAIDLHPADNATPAHGLLELTEERHVFRFGGVATRPAVSANRGFTAPIILKTDATPEDDGTLLRHDADSFNRWEAAQRLSRQAIMDGLSATRSATATHTLSDGLRRLLDDPDLDDAFKALMLQLPPEAEIAAAIGRDVDADAVHLARQTVRATLGHALKPSLVRVLDETQSTQPYVPDTAGTARRSLRYAALSLFAMTDPKGAMDIAAEDFIRRHSMTAEVGALGAILHLNTPDVDHMLEEFFQRHGRDPLLADKWFLLHATRPQRGVAARVDDLSRHPAFSFTTPNRVYALFGGFSANLPGFHAADGSGYELMADTVIRLNGINPQVAARMAGAFRSWHLYNAHRRNHAAAAMQRIIATPGLSRDVFEIISRTLSAN